MSVLCLEELEGQCWMDKNENDKDGKKKKKGEGKEGER